MNTMLRPALVLFAALSLLCGVLYPSLVTALGAFAFPAQVAGSLVQRNGQVLGSSLIGQAFTSPRYVWGRPSATTPMANNGASSGGSNLAPSNPALLTAIAQRIAALKAVDPTNKGPIPVDLVTASASGLDPDISVAGALYQAPRVARARAVPLTQVTAIITRLQQERAFGWLGEPRVNVLALNLALDAAGH